MAPNLSKDQAGSIRTFVAIELPTPILTTVAAVQEKLRVHAGALKIVAPDLLHLTVRFLGEVQPSQITAVEGATRRAAMACLPFRLTLSSVGSFGGSAPRVVWVGLEHDAGLGALLRLHRGLEEELAAAGFERDRRPLAPHLTIARVRDAVPRPEARALGDTIAGLAGGTPPSGSFEVMELTVMRSDLSPRGPRYTPLAHTRLGGT